MIVSKFKSAIICTLVLVLAISSNCLAQKEPQSFTARNAAFVEFGGNSGRYAVNFSRIIHQKEKLKLNVSAGFSMWHHYSFAYKSRTTKWLPVIPLEFSAFWGKSNHHLEIGTGITSFLQTGSDFDLDTFEITNKVVFSAFIPLRVGYRYQKPEGGFFFRVAYTPLFNVPFGGRGSWNFLPYFAGLSIGKSFK